MPIQSSKIISTDTPDLTSLGWQRWQLLDIDEFPDEPEHQETENHEATIEHHAEVNQVPQLTEDEINQIRQEAYQTGYTQGQKDGYQAGFPKGQQEGFTQGQQKGYQDGLTRGEEDILRFKQMADQLEAIITQIEHELPNVVLKMSLGLTRQMTRSALIIRPELVLPVVRQAIASLPQNITRPLLILNPADGELVRTLMQNELIQNSWEIIDDPTVSRGGCIIKSAETELDATLETRWKQIIQTLGSDDDGWLKSIQQ